MLIPANKMTTALKRAFLLACAILLAVAFAPTPLLSAADDGPPVVEKQGRGRGRGRDDSNSGDDNSGRGRGGDDNRGDDNSGRGRGADDPPGDDNGGGRRGVDDPPGDDRGGDRQRQASRSTRQRIEGKSRAIIDGFRAEFSVRFEKRFDRMKFRAEVSNLSIGDGTALAVCFNSASLGVIRVSSFNFGELELDSRLGQNVPEFTGGETFELRVGDCGGQLLMSAVLGGGAAGMGAPAPAAADRSRIEGKSRRLIDGFEAEFSVRFERRADRDKFRAQAENLNLGSGARLDVCFDGLFLGDIFLNSFSFGELELDTRLGQNVPVFEAGDTVELRQGGCGGDLLMAATFGAAAGNQPGAPRRRIEGKSRRLIDGFEAEFSARFEQRFDREKFRAEVSNLNLSEGAALPVCFEGAELGEIVLNSFHFGELELDSRLGQSIPVFMGGEVIELHQGSCAGDSLMEATLQ